MLLHKLYINVAIANNLLYRLALQNLLEPKYKNLRCHFVENRFLANISICVHFRSYFASYKLYINVAIANIFLYRPAL